MTFYQQQLLKIKSDHFAKDYLYTRIIRAKQFIDSSYCDHIDINAMAAEAHFSKFHFIRLFKLAYGKTPHQYLTSVRIEKAKFLLQSPAAISSICFGVGFDSISSFTGLLKKLTGITPSAFQNSQNKIKVVAGKTSIHYQCYYFAKRENLTKNRNFEEVTV